MTLSKEEFVTRANKVHKNQYTYSLVMYFSTKKKVEITCPIHGSFWQIAGDHLKGRGCPSCAIARIKSSLTLSQDEFIERATLTHNNKYDYSLSVYIKNNIKISIICPIHGVFEQEPIIHLAGSECQKCSELIRVKNITKSLDNFISEANIVHNWKFDYSEVEYVGALIKVKIICPLHDAFNQKPNAHLRGSGCPFCSIGNRTKTLDEFIDEAYKVHNRKYTYEQAVYINTLIKVKINCLLHGIFEQTPDAHLQGQGCPKCTSSVSKIEILWLDTINIPQFYRHKTIIINDKKLYVDAYDPNTNTIYEFYGNYWHGNPNIHHPDDINTHNNKSYGKLYKNTMERENLLISNGYKIVSIWENEFKKITRNHAPRN